MYLKFHSDALPTACQSKTTSYASLAAKVACEGRYTGTGFLATYTSADLTQVGDL